jgi:hypothetical protein
MSRCDIEQRLGTEHARGPGDDAQRQGGGRPGGTVEHVAIRRHQLQAHRRRLLILALETVPRPFYRALRLSTD